MGRHQLFVVQDKQTHKRLLYEVTLIVNKLNKNYLYIHNLIFPIYINFRFWMLNNLKILIATI